MANHSRRIELLERRYAPRQVFVWDDRSPGCVERTFAKLIKNGSARPEDEIVQIRWEESKEVGLRG